MNDEKMFSRALNTINETGDSYMKMKYKQQVPNTNKVNDKLFSRLHVDGKIKQEIRKKVMKGKLNAEQAL